MPFLEQNKMPLIGGYGVGQEYHTPYAYSFQSHHYGFEMGRFLAQESKVTHPGAIFISGNAAANEAQKRALTAGVKAGGKTLKPDDILQVDVTKASYDDAVTQFKLSGVDGIATIIDQTAYNRLQQAMDRQSYHPVHVADPLFTDPTVQQKSTTEGTLVASDFELPESTSAARAIQGNRPQGDHEAVFVSMTALDSIEAGRWGKYNHETYEHYTARVAGDAEADPDCGQADEHAHHRVRVGQPAVVDGGVQENNVGALFGAG